MAPLPAHIAAKLKRHAAEVGDWALAEDGREDDSHVTILFGLHGDDPSEVVELLKNEPPILLTLGRTSLFQNEDADVLKLDISSTDLHWLNKKLRALPHTDTHPDYVPHSTLAYVKSGLGKKWSGSDALSGTQAMIDHVVHSSRSGIRTKIPLKLQPITKRRAAIMTPP